jgi:membrane protease YdiL (CAAX protease family)
MSAMANTSGGFRAALFAGWMALCLIGLWYSRLKGIPSWAALPALAAFLVEYPFYLVPAFPSIREKLAGERLPVFLVVSAVLPYLVCSMGATQFQWAGLVKLTALALSLALWYRVFPPTPAADIGFLALVVAVKIGKFAAPIYPIAYNGVDIRVLGDLALFQIAVMVLMLDRRIRETGYGFLPSRKDWRIGAINYLYFLPIGFGLALVLKAMHLVKPGDPLKLAGYFLGWLLVLTLAEEFIFRGVLQQWIEDWTWSRPAALAITSLLFGAVHLWFRQFPNWKWLIIAAVLGWFCGRARNQAGSIRAGMVTHTLVITTWRAFFA